MDPKAAWNRGALVGGGGDTGGWSNDSSGWGNNFSINNNRSSGWGREREENPFAEEGASKNIAEVFDEENTGINFDAYEDIPVENSGDAIAPPVNTFSEIDLGGRS